MSDSIFVSESPIALGTWLSIGSPVIAELAAECGFDWVLIDLEHGSATEAAVPDQLRALRGTRTQGIVRVGAPDRALIGRVLDWGADGIMLPHVQCADEAAACVAAMRYPPAGVRGVSRTVRAYRYGLQEFPGTRQPVLLAQIEDPAGVANAAEIARVDGVDALFVGPSDLKFSLAQCSESDVPSYSQCLARVVSAARQAEKAAGILVRDLDSISEHLELGFTLLAAQSDLGILRAQYQGLVSSKK